MINNYHHNLLLPVEFVPIGRKRDYIEKNQINKEFIEWLNSIGLSVSDKKLNRYFECEPNKRLNIHADSLSPDIPRTKLNIMYEHHTVDVIFYKLKLLINHSRFIKKTIRIYPEKLCTEVYRTSSPLPCLFNSSEIHTAINGNNKGKLWKCYSLTLVNLNGELATFHEAYEKLKDYII